MYPPAAMANRAHVLACLIASFACPLTACQGCEDEDIAPPVRASKLNPIEDTRVGILERRAARKIDPAKTLTADAAGVTQCGEDGDCFVLTAERCAPSVLDHSQVVALFGVEQRVAARYTIVGETTGGCELRRELKSLEIELQPELIQALRSKGKTDADLAKIEADGYEHLRKRNPARLTCVFSADAVLDAALDLADGKYEARLWREGCKEEAR